MKKTLIDTERESAPSNASEYLQKHGDSGMKRQHILQHPEFHSLRDGEQMLVLHHMDPKYRKMKPADRWKMIKDVPRPPR